MSAPDDTIFARASGGGRAAIAVVRISGPATGESLSRLVGRIPEPRRATLASLKGPTTGLALDCGLVLWFPAPASFTGEDAAELHLHGGRAVVAAVLGALASLPGLRPAEAGEFTRRALRNGKLRLDEVEGLADLIDAETEAQRRQALRQMEGALGRWIDGLRERLIAAIALAEGAIDFAEEDDLVATFRRDMAAEVSGIRETIRGQLDASRRGEALREGLVVAIAGAPNVGKSTLLNALAGREIAIVSVHAGTTRDALEVDLDLGGYPLRLIDTAGLRDTDDPVEREGIVRARQRAGSADLVLWLRNSGDEERPSTGGKLWSVATKADMAPPGFPADFTISAQSGEGMDRLIAALRALVEDMLAGAEDALATRLRHRSGLAAALQHLHAVESFGESAALELVAEELRGAATALSSLLGDVDTEEILGQIFSRFCIGK